MKARVAGLVAVMVVVGCARKRSEIGPAPEKEHKLTTPVPSVTTPLVQYLVGRVGEHVAVQGRVSKSVPRITRPSPGKVVSVLLVDGTGMRITTYVAEHPSCDNEHVRLTGDVVVAAGYLHGGAAYAEPQLDADSWTCVP